jgi:hypothetical protein
MHKHTVQAEYKPFKAKTYMYIFLSASVHVIFVIRNLSLYKASIRIVIVV